MYQPTKFQQNQTFSGGAGFLDVRIANSCFKNLITGAKTGIRGTGFPPADSSGRAPIKDWGKTRNLYANM